MLNNTPFISIILPVYNGEQTLKGTLDSLIAQTYTHFELLIGIDGTKDGSKAIAETFSDERFIIIEHPKNLGLANNVNALIKASSTESDYVAMAEQDDLYVPQRIAWQIKAMQKNPKVGLVSGIAEFVGDNRKVLFPGLLVNNKQFPQGEALFQFLYINQLKVVNSCLMFRKSTHIYNQLRFKDNYGNFNVDWDYVLRFALVSEVYGIPKVLVHINRKSNNPSVTKQKWLQFAASRQLLKDFKKEFPNIIGRIEYTKALKEHRKIELGYRSRLGIIGYGIYYTFIYGDFYFLSYIKKRFKILISNNT